MRALLLATAVCLGLAGAARADDDGNGGPGGSSDGGGGADRGDRPPTGRPSTGDPLRDLRGFFGSFVGAAPAAAPPVPAGAPPPPPPRSAPPPAPPRSAPPPPIAASAVPGELAAIGLDAPARARLLAAGFSVLEETPALLVPGSIARLRIPPGSTPAAAVEAARRVAPAARIDLNHLYRPGSAAGESLAALPLPAAPARPEPRCAARPVGMIDTRIAEDHPALAGGRIERLTRRGAGLAPSGTAHGTAVAALLAEALGTAPMVAVDAFHGRPDGDAADAFDIAAGLALLAAREVAVVNLSFAGPDNAVLALATERVAARGLLLAAAAGNDGQQSPPRFPAAYPWVVAVTAVDRSRRPFVRAVRGPHLAFAAPGVGLAAPGRAGAQLSGTSYAVPFVSAAFAWAMTDQDQEAALRQLAGSAEDLGRPGRDQVFGWGLIRPPAGCGAQHLGTAW